MADRRRLTLHLGSLTAGILIGFSLRAAVRAVKHDADIAALRELVDQAASAELIVGRALKAEEPAPTTEQRPALRVIDGGKAGIPRSRLSRDRRQVFMRELARAFRASERRPPLQLKVWVTNDRPDSPEYRVEIVRGEEPSR